MFFNGFPFDDFQSNQKEEPPKDVDNNKYYDILQIKKDATEKDIKTAYRKLALKYHPDKKGGDIKIFQELSTAHEVLTDPEKKKIYDKYGEEGLKSNGPVTASYDNLFSQLFGMGGKEEKRTKEKDAVYPLNVDLEDVYNGTKKSITIKRYRICTECNGTGGKEGAILPCSQCKGKGKIAKMVQLGQGMYSQTIAICEKCNGKGETYDNAKRCSKCKGNRVIENTKSAEVTIEKGMPSGGTISLYGEADEYPGLEPGDVIVQIKIKQHKIYKRKGADLLIKKKISLYEALTSAPFSIKHINGKIYYIESPQGTIIKPGELKTVEGLGMPFYKTPYNFGNMFIIFDVEFPNVNPFNEISNRHNKSEDKGVPVHKLIEFDRNQKSTTYGKEEDSNSYNEDNDGDEDDRAHNIGCQQQ